MNRRNFIGGLLTAAAGFTILPGAGRIWKAQPAVLGEEWVVNPDWVDAPFELAFWMSDAPIVFPQSPLPVPVRSPLPVMAVLENGVYKIVPRLIKA